MPRMHELYRPGHYAIRALSLQLTALRLPPARIGTHFMRGHNGNLSKPGICQGMHAWMPHMHVLLVSRSS